MERLRWQGVILLLMIVGFSLSGETVLELSAEKGFIDLSPNNLQVEAKNVEIKEEGGKKFFSFSGEGSFLLIERNSALSLTKNFLIETEIRVYPEQKVPLSHYLRIISHGWLGPRGGYELAVYGGKLTFWTSGATWVKSALEVMDGKWHRVGVKVEEDILTFFKDDEEQEISFVPPLPSENRYSFIGAHFGNPKKVGNIRADLRYIRVIRLGDGKKKE